MNELRNILTEKSKLLFEYKELTEKLKTVVDSRKSDEDEEFLVEMGLVLDDREKLGLEIGKLSQRELEFSEQAGKPDSEQARWVCATLAEQIEEIEKANKLQLAKIFDGIAQKLKITRNNRKGVSAYAAQIMER